MALVAVSLITAPGSHAQNSIKVEAPNVVGANEQFNVTFIIEGEKSPSDFSAYFFSSVDIHLYPSAKGYRHIPDSSGIGHCLW